MVKGSLERRDSKGTRAQGDPAIFAFGAVGVLWVSSFAQGSWAYLQDQGTEELRLT